MAKAFNIINLNISSNLVYRFIKLNNFIVRKIKNKGYNYMLIRKNRSNVFKNMYNIKFNFFYLKFKNLIKFKTITMT